MLKFYLQVKVSELAPSKKHKKVIKSELELSILQSSQIGKPKEKLVLLKIKVVVVHAGHLQQPDSINHT